MPSFLKTIRKKNGMTQAFLAKELGVSRPTYVQLENGERKMYVEEAFVLSNLFGLSISEFLEERDQPILEVEFKVSKSELITNEKKSSKPHVRISVPQERADKFKEVLLYILEQIGARPNIGEAMLCKMMYFIDFDFYEKYEEQLVGATYIKNHHGPTPAAFSAIVKQMEKDGELIRVVKKYFQYDQKKYLPLRSADFSSFTIREKELIDMVIERYKDFDAKQMEHHSHGDVPWITTEHLQPIDYESVFYRTDAYSVRQYDDEL